MYKKYGLRALVVHSGGSYTEGVDGLYFGQVMNDVLEGVSFLVG